ncbi:MAG: peptide deformylase [Anaerolineaceae bacterium]|nr:peptide deformylase [Anaerolineaceae bacterium]
MALREVIKLPHPTLRRKAHKIVEFNAELQQLIEDMIETMRDEPGVGLAAPQVNISQRLIVVEYPENDSDPNAKPKVFVLANPELTQVSSEKVKGVEGCLSVPNLYGEVERSQSVTVRGQNRHGKKVTIKADGWLARIFQHEIDHLNGVLFVDRTDVLYRPEDAPNWKHV